MRTLLSLLVLGTVIFLGSMLPSSAQNQNEMNQQAWADFEKADKELNQVYQKALKSIDDDVTRKKFVEAQKAWLKFRDAQGAFISDEMRGGSAEPLLLAGSYLTTTQARIVQLKKYLTSSTEK